MTGVPRDLTRTVLALLFIGGLIASSFLVIQPFLAATIWAVTLVIATWPLMIRAQAGLGGRRWAAVTVMTIALLLIVLLPLSAAIGAIVAHSDQIAAFIATAPHYRPGPPPTWLAEIPFIG